MAYYKLTKFSHVSLLYALLLYKWHILHLILASATLFKPFLAANAVPTPKIVSLLPPIISVKNFTKVMMAPQQRPVSKSVAAVAAVNQTTSDQCICNGVETNEGGWYSCEHRLRRTIFDPATPHVLGWHWGHHAYFEGFSNVERVARYCNKVEGAFLFEDWDMKLSPVVGRGTDGQIQKGYSAEDSWAYSVGLEMGSSPVGWAAMFGLTVGSPTPETWTISESSLRPVEMKYGLALVHPVVHRSNGIMQLVNVSPLTWEKDPGTEPSHSRPYSNADKHFDGPSVLWMAFTTCANLTATRLIPFCKGNGCHLGVVGVSRSTDASTQPSTPPPSSSS
ncbi:hypothetical protein HDV05_001361 [Chytridiales sp. JEL 0842]|nr:hypothetical protein HDV05_001361 [Chytridiales sp. JEL 0842]